MSTESTRCGWVEPAGRPDFGSPGAARHRRAGWAPSPSCSSVVAEGLSHGPTWIEWLSRTADPEKVALRLSASGMRLEPGGTIELLTIRRMNHVGIVVDDLAVATDFFVQLEGRWVDRVVGLEDIPWSSR